MLILITGRAGSGKSETVAQKIEALARNGGRSVLVVPEQASFDAERSLTLRLGDALCPLCEVRSFRRLCADIFAARGGGARRRLSDAARSVLVRRAVSSLGGGLVCFRRMKRDTAFFTAAASLIDELKNGGVTPELLGQTAALCPGALSQQKLRELSQIYAAYEAAIADKFYDGASELQRAAALCPGAGIFSGRTVFLDGFSGFTQPEFSMIAAMAAQAEDVVCALCCGDVWSDADDALAGVRKTARLLLALAKRAGVDTRIELCAGAPRYSAPGLACAERYFSGEKGAEQDARGVFSPVCGDMYDEAAETAAEIARLVREESYDYSDIAVIVRDYSRYRTVIERTFDRFSIPFFSGEERTMEHSPAVLFYLAALELASGISTAALTRLLRTSLTRLSDDSIDELLNYAFVWNIDGGAWYAPFTNNPDGPDARRDDARLARIETARGSVAEWMGAFIDRAKGTDGASALREVYGLFCACGAADGLARAQTDVRAEASAALALTDQLYAILEGEDASIAETRELLRLIAAAAPVREIPPALQQVNVGSADRIRTDNPRAVFILGLNDGVFPRTSFDAPLLSFAERELLAQQGAALSHDFETTVTMEELYLYRAVSAPRERLYLCRPTLDGRGTALRPSAAVAAFIETNGAEAMPADPLRRVVNGDTAASVYAAALERGDAALARTLLASGYGGACVAVRAAAQAPAYALLDTEALRRSLGDPLTLSASRIEAFEKCRFSYFLSYTLGIRPLTKAEMSPVEAGTFVHAVIERVMRALGGDLTNVAVPALTTLTEESAQAFLDARIGSLARTDARLQYIAECLKKQAVRLLLRLRREQLQSSFRPRDFELKLGRDVPALVVETPDGDRLRVEGSVDRVDTFEKDGVSYVRVIDYKTGEKHFNLADIFYGLNLQMLLYLFAICDGGGARYKNTIPAGVLYMPADPAAPTVAEERAAQQAERAYRMDGLLLDDPKVLHAMESEGRGIFIPVETDTEGKPIHLRGNSQKDKLASLEKLGSIKKHIDATLVEMAQALYAGDIGANPLNADNENGACTYCEFSAVCRRDRVETERKRETIDTAALFQEGGEGNG
ncbi:MAG: PD-(D/E)XK nuclease family protein [Oscillospiraceae bacterium]|nr:PD-(D/E)XK nuclease family protein [Oscillospiraceae bacterium]